MRDLLIKLLSNGKNHPIEITVFSVWHIGYVVGILALIFTAAYLLRNKSSETKEKVLNRVAIATLTLYIVDFFLHPFYRSSGNMNIDKLPFHICTLMGIVIVYAQFSKKNNWIKEVAVPLAMAGSLMYLVYPGSALGGITPWSYEVVQTFAFHGLLLSWGVLMLTTKSVELKWKNIWRHLVALVVIALWAALGNALYTNPNHHYDWFFITGSTFPFVPTWLMPIAVISAVYGMVVIFYLINSFALRWFEKRKQRAINN